MGLGNPLESAIFGKFDTERKRKRQEEEESERWRKKMKEREREKEKEYLDLNPQRFLIKRMISKKADRLT